MKNLKLGEQYRIEGGTRHVRSQVGNFSDTIGRTLLAPSLADDHPSMTAVSDAVNQGQQFWAVFWPLGNDQHGEGITTDRSLIDSIIQAGLDFPRVGWAIEEIYDDIWDADQTADRVMHNDTFIPKDGNITSQRCKDPRSPNPMHAHMLLYFLWLIYDLLPLVQDAFEAKKLERPTAIIDLLNPMP